MSTIYESLSTHRDLLSMSWGCVNNWFLLDNPLFYYATGKGKKAQSSVKKRVTNTQSSFTTSLAWKYETPDGLSQGYFFRYLFSLCAFIRKEVGRLRLKWGMAGFLGRIFFPLSNIKKWTKCYFLKLCEHFTLFLVLEKGMHKLKYDRSLRHSIIKRRIKQKPASFEIL